MTEYEIELHWLGYLTVRKWCDTCLLLTDWAIGFVTVNGEGQSLRGGCLRCEDKKPTIIEPRG